jgi:hypothetical protein
MAVSGVSSTTAIASIASEMKTEKVQQQIAVSVMKQIQDTQKLQGEALIKMMSDVGSIIDRSA